MNCKLFWGIAVAVTACGSETPIPIESPLPVAPAILVDGRFKSSEGMAILEDGRMFVTADKAIWEVEGDGSVRSVAQVTSPVGLAPDGRGGLFVADAGPQGAFSADHPTDGIVWRVSPDGNLSEFATGIPDPNFILVRRDGSVLVSDDFGDVIYSVPAGGGAATLFHKGIAAPNGMVESIDGKRLFVAQTFTEAGGLALDSRVWTAAISDSGLDSPSVLATLPEGAANDGVALDAKGRLYVAANLIGKIFRIDTDSGSSDLVASGMLGVASLAFGRGGSFSKTSLYATQLIGGKVYEIPLGVEGAPLP